MPFLAQELFDSRWSFCANYVTGRRFRFRSSASVIAELNTWHAACR